MNTETTELQLHRAAVLSGILFALLQLGALAYFAAEILPHFAPIDAPAAERAASTAKLGASLRVGNYLLALPTPFFLLFLGGLSSALTRREPDAQILAMTALAAGAAMAMLWPLGAVITDIELAIAQ